MKCRYIYSFDKHILFNCMGDNIQLNNISIVK